MQLWQPSRTQQHCQHNKEPGNGGSTQHHAPVSLCLRLSRWLRFFARSHFGDPHCNEHWHHCHAWKVSSPGCLRWPADSWLAGSLSVSPLVGLPRCASWLLESLPVGPGWLADSLSASPLELAVSLPWSD